MTDSEAKRSAAPAVAASHPAAHLRSTVKHGLIYSIGVILSRLVGFVMIPIYTRVLRPEDYGVLEILSLTTDVVTMLAGFGIGLAVIRTLSTYDKEDERRLVGSTAALLLATGFFAIAVVGLTFSDEVALLLLGAGAVDDGGGLVRLTVLGMAFGSTLEVPMAMLRARQDSRMVVSIGMTRLLISLTLNIVLVVKLRLGVTGVLWSTLLTSIVMGGWLTARLVRDTGLRFSTSVARQLVAFGAPLAVWNLASFTMHYSDRYFLRSYGTFDDVGLYSLSYKLAMLLPLLVVGPFSDIWIPKSLEIERTEGPSAKRILPVILGYYNVLLVTVALGIALFAGDLIRLVTGPAYHPAAKPVPLLVFAMVFFGYRAIAQMGALIRGRSDLIAGATAAAALTALALNYVLIPRFGIMGAALATSLGFGLEFLLMRRLSAAVYDVKVPLLGLMRPVSVALVVWGMVTFLTPATWGLSLRVLANTLAVALYGAGLFLTGALSHEDRQALRRSVRDPRWLVAQLRAKPTTHSPP